MKIFLLHVELPVQSLRIRILRNFHGIKLLLTAQKALNFLQNPNASSIFRDNIIVSGSTNLADNPIDCNSSPEYNPSLAGDYQISCTAKNQTGNSSAPATFTIHILPSKNPIINEIAYRATTNDDTNDWIEIYNPNDFAIDISNFYLQDSTSLTADSDLKFPV